ncbi:tRNA-specific adenosine deaminase [Alphaproteobacteria bacterium]|nr:tRNA-specific adenosine deaminase [Alphaproteobacteria bacterium]
MQPNYFMQYALKQAQIAYDKDEVPIGAVIVENNKIIASAHNSNLLDCDATAHCEILAIRRACLYKNSPRLDNCDIYITVEPCAMCYSAISLAHIKRIYFAINDEKFGAISNNLKEFTQKLCYHQPEIYDGIAHSESKILLQNFFQIKRNKKNVKI